MENIFDILNFKSELDIYQTQWPTQENLTLLSLSEEKGLCV